MSLSDIVKVKKIGMGFKIQNYFKVNFIKCYLVEGLNIMSNSLIY
jgi:hypothetical protein